MTTTSTNIGQKELPAGWKWVKLGDVCEQLKPGELHSLKSVSTEGSVPVVSQSETGFIGYHDDPPGIHASVNEPIVTFANHTCAVRLHTYPFSTIQNVFPFRAKANSDIDFLYWLLRGRVPTTFYGGHMPVLRTTDLPLPPLGEQKRIAGILNEQMAAVEEAKKAAQERLEAAQALPSAYLREVFEGEEAQGWPLINIGDEKITALITDGTHTTPSYTDEGIPFLSVKDLTGGSISFEDCRYISTEEHEELIKRCHPKLGDVLYTKVGTTGVAKVVDVQRPFSIFVSVALIKPTEDVESRYLEYALNSPLGKLQAKELTQGMANKNLVIRDIKAIKLPIATIDTQRLIVKELDDKIAGVKLAEASIQQELDTIEAMPAALLRKAFSGGL